MSEFDPRRWASLAPERRAVEIVETGRSLTYAALMESSQRLADALYELGLRPKDRLAILIENRPEFFEIAWACQRSGLNWVPINWHLQTPEIAHILKDSGAKVLIASVERLPLIDGVDLAGVTSIIVGEGGRGLRYADVIAAAPEMLGRVDVEGRPVVYSSGTTGLPKGVTVAEEPRAFGSGVGFEAHLRDFYGLGEETVYLSPAPLYHAAPLSWTLAVQRLGGRVLVMERFDPVGFLAAIQKHRVTHLQVVPTMFVRLLKLPEAQRRAFDLSSLRCVIHAAAPCPVDVKAAMIDWFGPIISEFYGASEGHGMTGITSTEWLAHPGSVGRATVGVLHIAGEDGVELGPNQPGLVYFEGGRDFAYHNDPEKTASTRHPNGWSTVGDIGYLDEEGYLYLTDRQSHMIISGGVNVYPQEAENVLAMHPAVEDVAVIGVPDPDLGEAVKAVVLASAAVKPDEATAAALIAYCRERLAHYKCPKSVDFVTELPRLPSGKMLKRVLRDRYWPAKSPAG